MPVFPCARPPAFCDQQPNPVTTYSSETVDGPTFIGIAWNAAKPLLGKNFNVYPCEDIEQSQLSQQDADLAASRGALACGNPCSVIFSNKEQTARGVCTNGFPYFFTVPAGIYTALNQVLADRIAFTVASAQVNAHPVCLGNLPNTTMCLGSFYQSQVSASGPDVPFSFSITSGSLPPGISMSTSVAGVTFFGTPTTLGTFSITLKVSNSAGVFGFETITMFVTTITTSSALADAFFNTPYSQALSIFNPAGDPVAWSLVGGALPDGLTLNSSTGIISGTPTGGGGLTNFTVQALIDGSNCTKQFVINAQFINWDQTVWSLIQVVAGGGAGGTATGNFLGRNFSVSGKGNGSPSAKVEALGTLTYTGPAVNCKITITVTAQGGSPSGLFIIQDGVQRLLINSGLTVGVHVFPFPIIAGVNSSITIIGLTDILDPARLFIFSSDSILWAWSATLAQA